MLNLVRVYCVVTFCILALFAMLLGPAPTCALLVATVIALGCLEAKLQNEYQVSLCPAPILRLLRRGPAMVTGPIFTVAGTAAGVITMMSLVVFYETIEGHPFPDCDITLLEGLARLFCC